VFKDLSNDSRINENALFAARETTTIRWPNLRYAGISFAGDRPPNVSIAGATAEKLILPVIAAICPPQEHHGEVRAVAMIDTHASMDYYFMGIMFTRKAQRDRLIMTDYKSRNIGRLRNFVTAFARMLDQSLPEEAIIEQGSQLLKELVAVDDWLPDAYAQPDRDRYLQYLLHADSLGRFSVVSFVWGPGQRTPVHDHTVWGLIGMLRGAEISQAYALQGGALLERGQPIQLAPGQVEAVSPRIGDIHRVSNAYTDCVSVSIHVYGANIGGVKRSVYQPDGTRNLFISGYSNQTMPNIWDLSAESSTV
jgi:predicted metal-dependent enzyme (double-stranded beta helix superfamily)